MKIRKSLLACSFMAGLFAAVPAWGTVYVTNWPNGTVSTVPNTGGAATTFATGLNHPEGITITPSGTIYVVNQTTGVIDTLSSTGAVALEYSAPEGLPESIVTDQVRFRQVLFNLIGNAIKFTADGSVRIVARVTQIGESRKLSVDVIDSGIGISEEAVAKIFMPFVQADTSITRKFGGTGLGLSISRRLAEAMGGTITVKSESGKGSTFTMTIDVGDPTGVAIVSADSAMAAMSADASPAKVTPANLPAARVLVVDDSNSNRKLARLVLERAGMSVRLADNGADAVKLVASETFDIILMDMHMPIMDGFAATTVLRERGCELPIIAMTADVMKGDEDKCLAAGCTGFLPKPIDMDRMLAVVAGAAAKETVLAPSSPQADVSAVETGAPDPRSRAALADLEPIKSKLPSDDPEFCEIVDEFIGRLHQQMEAMKSAFAAEDLRELASAAHWLKGSGGTAGFDDFTKPAANLERLAKDSQVERIAAALAELQTLADRVQGHGKMPEMNLQVRS